MRRSLAPIVIAIVLALGACRQVAGIQDIVADASAGDGGACVCSGCTMLASGLSVPASLVRIGDELYVLDYGNENGQGSLVAVPTSGGSPRTLERGLTRPYSLATDGTDLYWLGETEGGKGLVEKLSPSGGASAVTLASNQMPPTAGLVARAPSNTQIALAAKDVYFIDDLSGSPLGVKYVPKGGGAVKTLLGSSLPPGLDDAGTPEGGLAPFLFPKAIQTDGESLFVATDNGTNYIAIFRVPLSGGPAEPVADNLSGPLNMALSGADVLFLDSPFGGVDTGTLQIVPESGGSPKTLAQGIALPWAITVDNGFAYCVDNGFAVTAPASIFKVAVTGGTPVKLARASSPEAVVTDSTSIYWVDSACGTVMKASK